MSGAPTNPFGNTGNAPNPFGATSSQQSAQQTPAPSSGTAQPQSLAGPSGPFGQPATNPPAQSTSGGTGFSQTVMNVAQNTSAGPLSERAQKVLEEQKQPGAPSLQGSQSGFPTAPSTGFGPTAQSGAPSSTTNAFAAPGTQSGAPSTGQPPSNAFGSTTQPSTGAFGQPGITTNAFANPGAPKASPFGATTAPAVATNSFAAPAQAGATTGAATAGSQPAAGTAPNAFAAAPAKPPGQTGTTGQTTGATGTAAPFGQPSAPGPTGAAAPFGQTSTGATGAFGQTASATKPGATGAFAQTATTATGATAAAGQTAARTTPGAQPTAARPGTTNAFAAPSASRPAGTGTSIAAPANLGVLEQKRINEVLSTWQTDINKQKSEFQKQVSQIKKVEREVCQLNENNVVLTDFANKFINKYQIVSDSVDAVIAEQLEMEKQLTEIETYYSRILDSQLNRSHSNRSSVEERVDIYQKTADTYSRAMDVMDRIDGATRRFNEEQESWQGNLDEVGNMFNLHVCTLNHLESQLQGLEKRMGSVERTGPK